MDGTQSQSLMCCWDSKGTKRTVGEISQRNQPENRGLQYLQQEMMIWETNMKVAKRSEIWELFQIVIRAGENFAYEALRSRIKDGWKYLLWQNKLTVIKSQEAKHTIKLTRLEIGRAKRDRELKVMVKCSWNKWSYHSAG